MKRREMVRVFLLAFAFAAFSLTGCGGGPGEIRKGEDNSPAASADYLKPVANSRYVILPGDEIEIKFSYHPQYNEKIEVLPDGNISLSLVHEVVAAWKTPSELAAELKKSYSKELKDPEVVVMVRRSNGRVSYVGGEIRNPQVVPLVYPVTLLQAVIRCGDVTGTANQSNVLILRAVPNRSPKVITVDLGLIRSGGTSDVPLEPYDIVYVPRTTIAKVNEFVESYINRIIPKAVSFPFTYEIHSESKR